MTTDRPPIPDDLQANWRWTERGALARQDRPLLIVADVARIFEIARTYDAAAERTRARLGLKQTRMEL